MIDINSIDQGQVYMLYEVFKNLEHDLDNKTPEEITKLASVKAEIGTIEEWANKK